METKNRMNETTNTPKSRFSRRHQDGTAHAQAGMAREERIKRAQDEADANRLARASRSPEEQLALLDKRLGAGKGAERERTRLLLAVSAARAEAQARKRPTRADKVASNRGR